MNPILKNIAYDTIPMPPTEEGWLEERRKGIGGSDAAAACGVSQWNTRLGLFMDKTGQAPDKEETQRMYWGKRLEGIVAEEYAKRTGHTVDQVNAILRSRAHPFMLANPDRAVLDDNRGLGILECKTVDRYAAKEWGEDGSDQVPKEYLIQCQHYLAVTGLPWADLAVLIGGNEFRIYTLPRSEDLITNLVDLEAEFWGMVKMNQAPEPDCNHPTTRELLKKLYPNTNGEVLDLADLAADHEHLREAKAQLKELEGVERFHTNRIMAAMGEAAVGLLPDGTGYTRSWRNPYTRAASEVAGGFVLKFAKKPKGV